jgi:hypothetical protein
MTADVLSFPPAASLMAGVARAPATPLPPTTTASVDPGISPAADPATGGLDGDTLYKFFLNWETAKSGERADMAKAWRYYHHKHWTSEQLAVLAARNQLPTIWNRIARKINFLVGTQQRLRRDPKAYPRTPMHEADADVASAVLRYVHDTTQWSAEASNATLDFFVAGIGVSYLGAEGADVVKRWVPCHQFFYDPRSIDPMFKDAKYLGVVKWVDIDAARKIVSAIGGDAEEIDGLINTQRDGLVTWDQRHQWVHPHERRVRLVEMWYRHDDAWRCAYLCGPVKLGDVPAPYERDGKTAHPYNAVSCHIDEQGDRYGIVAGMIPVQDEINFIHSKLTWSLAARQVFFESGAFGGKAADIDKVRRELMKANGLIELAPGALKDKKIDIQRHDAEIAGWTSLLQGALAEIENLGPNPGLIGRGEGINTQSGRAILAQQNAGMTELSPAFERLREWQLSGYKIDWSLVRQFWTQEKIIRVTDDDQSSRFLKINEVRIDPMTGAISLANQVAAIDVDIILEEGPDTVTMKEEMLQTFAQLGQAAIGPLGKVLIELSNMPNKAKLLQLMDEAQAPPPEVAQMTERMAKLEAALKEMQVAKAAAEVENKRADTLAKLAPIMIPPQVLANVFPIPFADTGGPPEGPPTIMGPDAAMMGPLGPGMPPMQQGPDPRSLPPGGLAGPPDPRVIAEPVAGGPGQLPMPPPGILPAQPALN